MPLKKYAVESGTRTHRQRVRGAARWPLDVFIEASVRSDGQARIARAAPGGRLSGRERLRPDLHHGTDGVCLCDTFELRSSFPD